MNRVVESILPLSGHAWGDTLLFPSFVGDFTYDTLNAPDQERLVTSLSSLTVDGYLVNAFDIKKSNVEKAVSIKRVIFTSEREVQSFSNNDNLIGDDDGVLLIDDDGNFLTL